MYVHVLYVVTNTHYFLSPSLFLSLSIPIYIGRCLSADRRRCVSLLQNTTHLPNLMCTNLYILIYWFICVNISMFFIYNMQLLYFILNYLCIYGLFYYYVFINYSFLYTLLLHCICVLYEKLIYIFFQLLLTFYILLHIIKLYVLCVA